MGGFFVYNEAMRPGQLIDHIKEKGFTTISKASGDLGISVEEIWKAIEFLRSKRHLIRLDMSGDSDCESGSCGGCKGCSATYAIQEDDKPIIYTLSPIASR
ncbi:MAG: hypothetical protein KAH30_06920 [Caldisericia bacterium]|nr:hypothetical protein [Caldisericia bacterium]